MTLILGIAGGRGPTVSLCSTDASDPALDRFLSQSWSTAVTRDTVDLSEVAPGLYPLTVDADYQVVGSELIRVYLEIVEGARDATIDEAFEAVMFDTGRAGDGPPSFPDGLRAVRTTLLLEVPSSTPRMPAASPEIAASFTHAVRKVLGRLRRSRSLAAGDHVLDLQVERVGERWRVEPLSTSRESEMVGAFLAALRQSGLLAEGAQSGGVGGRVSLWVRSHPAKD